MTYSNSYYNPPDFKIIDQPFKVDEVVRPHINFGHYYPGVKKCTVLSCEKGHCQTGWLVKVKEFKGEYDSSWFFKIKK